MLFLFGEIALIFTIVVGIISLVGIAGLYLFLKCDSSHNPDRRE